MRVNGSSLRLNYRRFAPALAAFFLSACGGGSVPVLPIQPALILTADGSTDEVKMTSAPATVAFEMMITNLTAGMTIAGLTWDLDGDGTFNEAPIESGFAVLQSAQSSQTTHQAQFQYGTVGTYLAQVNVILQNADGVISPPTTESIAVMVGPNWTTAVIDAGTAGEIIGEYASLESVLSGSPAVSYQASTPAWEHELRFAYADTATGADSSDWHINDVVDTGTGLGPGFSGSLGLWSNSQGTRPTIGYFDGTTGDLKVATRQNVAATGGWTVLLLESGALNPYPSFLDFNPDSMRALGQTSVQTRAGGAAVAFLDGTAVRRYFSSSPAGDTLANWTGAGSPQLLADPNFPLQITGIHGVSGGMVIGGRLALCFTSANAGLTYAINSLPDGSGTWTFVELAEPNSLAFNPCYPCLQIVAGKPAIAYWAAINSGGSFNGVPARLMYATTTAGSGTLQTDWTHAVVDTSPLGHGGYVSFAPINGRPGIAYIWQKLTGITQGQVRTELRYAASATFDGLTANAWTLSVVDSTTQTQQLPTTHLPAPAVVPGIEFPSLANVDNKAAIAYCEHAGGASSLHYAISD